jgi:hypothetical protein
VQIIIILLIGASYFIGAKAIYQNKYRPSIYTRIIWFLLTVNSFASVILLKNNFSVILFSGLTLAGSLIILLLSLKKARRIFGPTEIISTFLLMVSLAFWVFTRLPLLNLSIGLIISFIGGIPTLKQVIKNPNDEDILFWLFFALAAIITLISADKSNISGYLYPLYLAIFNIIMTLLCMRRYIAK